MKTYRAGGFFPRLLTLFMGVMSPAAAVAGGAWVHEPNKFYAETTFGYYQAGEIFRSDGNRAPNRIVRDPTNPASVFAGLVDNTYRQYEGNFYMEYGVPYDFELSLSFPFYRVAQQDSEIGNFEATGIGDLIAGVKYKWFERSWLLSAFQVEVGIPSGDETAQGHVSGQVPHAVPLGDGEWDVALRMFASRGFHPIPAYASVSFGYRFRNSGGGVDFDDDMPWIVEGGYIIDFERHWFPKLTPFLEFRGLISTGTLRLSGFQGLEASGNTPNQEFIDIQPGLSVGIFDHFSWISSFAYTLVGKNTGAGWGMRSGLSWEN